MFKINFRLLTILIATALSSQSLAQQEFWTVGTGKTIPKGHLEVSVFRPARYGITRTLEVSAQPFGFLLLFPNGQVKKNWYDREISIATVHGLNYPTMFLKRVAKKDRPEYIHRRARIPQLLVFKNEVIASKLLKEGGACDPPNYLLSLKLGVQFAAKFKESTLPKIYKPVIFHRTSVYHDKVLWYVGADLDAHLNSFINYCVDVDFLSVGFDIEDWAVEHKGLITVKLTNSLMATLGYKLSVGTYIGYFGTGIYPLFDISWTYKFKNLKEKELDLFEDGNRF